MIGFRRSKREIPHFLLKFNKNHTFRTSGPKCRDPGRGYIRAAEGILKSTISGSFWRKSALFDHFGPRWGGPPGRALEAGPLALSVEGPASDERAGPLIGGPGL